MPINFNTKYLGCQPCDKTKKNKIKATKLRKSENQSKIIHFPNKEIKSWG